MLLQLFLDQILFFFIGVLEDLFMNVENVMEIKDKDTMRSQHVEERFSQKNLYSSSLQLCYSQLSYFRSYSILNWVQKTRVRLFFPQLGYFSPQFGYFLIFSPKYYATP